MKNETHNTIHDHEFALIGDFFKRLDRQGPGSPEHTLKALDCCGKLPENARIADLGCGTGGQTLQLAWNTEARITAVDLMPAFTDSLRERIAGTRLEERVTVINGSMDDLPFEEDSLDLIWSEGAISHIGFGEGLEYWRRFLKPGACLAVTEATWFTPEPPAEIFDFWHANYPGIDTIPTKIVAMEQAGYLPEAHFALPQACWRNYYRPIAAHFDRFLSEHAHSPAARFLVENFKQEMDLYSRYKDYYGYVFYIGRKA